MIIAQPISSGSGWLAWCVSCVQEKREEYLRAQREKEDREIEEKKQAARHQVEFMCMTLHVRKYTHCMYSKLYSILLTRFTDDQYITINQSTASTVSLTFYYKHSFTSLLNATVAEAPHPHWLTKAEE